MRKSRVAVVVVLLLALALAGAALVGDSWYRKPLPLPRSPFDFEVRSGASLSSVARSLGRTTGSTASRELGGRVCMVSGVAGRRLKRLIRVA